MVVDHADSNAKLAAAARAARLAVPDALDEERRAVADELARRHGHDFDEAYVRRQRVEHQKAVQLFEWEVGAGQNEALKAFARESLPVLFEHLQGVQGLPPLARESARTPETSPPAQPDSR